MEILVVREIEEWKVKFLRIFKETCVEAKAHV
jgi:hypothetical protein